MKAHQYPFYQAFYASFFSRSLYRDVANRWRGLGFTYLFILQAICLCFLLLQLNFAVSEFIETKSPEILAQIPAITITDGTVSTPESKPYFITFPEDDQLFAVIDTTGQYTSLEQAQATMLLTKHELIVENNEYENRVFNLKQVDYFSLDRSIIKESLTLFKNYYATLMYPFALVFFFVYRIIQILIYAVIGYIIAQKLRPQLNYSTMLRLGSVAITPTLLLEALFRLMGISFLPGWGILGVLLVLGYLYFAIQSQSTQTLENHEGLN